MSISSSVYAARAWYGAWGMMFCRAMLCMRRISGNDSMTNQTIYTVGGTVQAGGGVYIPRKADDELLAHCRASEFAFILSSRQVGKSSLMVRTARQLESENIRSAIIDLSSIGVEISVDEWYL